MTEDVPREICTNISGDLAHMALASREVAGFLAENGASPRVAYVVQLVVEELIMNIINYAHDDCAVHDIAVRVAFEAGHAVVEIEDDGRPFNPLDAPNADICKPLEERPVGGLGLHLVRQMADNMYYRRAGGKNHVEVQIALDHG